jgi:hypothetical protein
MPAGKGTPQSPIGIGDGIVPDHSKVILCYDWDGNPLTFDEYLAYVTTNPRRHVGDTEINGYRVSTVWTGAYANVMGPPLIFETMVFSRSGKVLLQTRYANAELAAMGHVRICDMVRMEDDPNKWEL